MKVDELRERVVSEKFDVIAITETWATGDISDCELAIEGYVLYRQDRRPGIKGGGVMIKVNDSLNSRPLLQLSNSNFQESVWCQIQLKFGSGRLLQKHMLVLQITTNVTAVQKGNECAAQAYSQEFAREQKSVSSSGVWGHSPSRGVKPETNANFQLRRGRDWLCH